MDITIDHKGIFEKVKSCYSPIYAKIKVGEEMTWVIWDQHNCFKFINFLNKLTLIEWTIHFPASKEFIAFMNYLGLFYDLDLGEYKP